MSATIGISWEDGHGKLRTQAINQCIDIRDYLGTPGYSMLAAAANRDLGVPDIKRFLELQARDTKGVDRSLAWIRRRRWMFQRPGADNGNGPKANRDGLDGMALAIMTKHPTASVRRLVAVLQDHGITRCREWVRIRRCDGLG